MSKKILLALLDEQVDIRKGRWRAGGRGEYSFLWLMPTRDYSVSNVAGMCGVSPDKQRTGRRFGQTNDRHLEISQKCSDCVSHSSD